MGAGEHVAEAIGAAPERVDLFKGRVMGRFRRRRGGWQGSGQRVRSSPNSPGTWALRIGPGAGMLWWIAASVSGSS